ncbi:MAG: glycosyltransferase family 2 protein [Deltaproteobacteria bacterium]|nr:glycosyltransferase family 2 protein [Deltaproteobacteria bacterium]
MKPLIVIPSRDNAATIVEVAAGCLVHCPDVLVVDDGSSDGTGDAARAVDGVVVLTHPENRGKGVALATALDHAHAHGFTHLVAIDADGQHLPEELPRFLEAARADPHAIHVGCREMDGAPGSSRFGRRFSNFWIWVETGHRVGDSQSGYRVYPVRPVHALRLRGRRYEWEVEVLVRALWAGIAVRDVPCSVRYPEERVSSFRPFHDNVRISLLNTRLTLGRLFWPPRWINRVPEPGGEWQGTHLGRIWGWTFFLWMIRLLGRWPTYGAMWIMASFYLLFSAAHRWGAQAYLRRVFPDAGAPSLWWRNLRLYHAFACSLVDRFLLLGRGPDAFRFVHEGTEAAREAIASGGAIFLSSHLGNSDLGGAALQTEQDCRPTVNVVQYTAQGDPYLHLIRRYAKDNAPQIISLNEGHDLAALEALRALRRGEVVALKGDRVIDEHTAEVSLLGGRVAVPTGPYLLAALSDSPLFLLGCFKEDATTYRVIASEPLVPSFRSRATRAEDLQQWAQRFADQMEEWARRYPLQWYNFFDPWLPEP